MDINIIFEDDSILVIDKPSGLTVNKAETTKGQETVQEWLLLRHPGVRRVVQSRDEEEFQEKSGIVHRLDKDTSGVLIIAKTFEAYLKLKEQFQNRETEKKYIALVHGIVDPAVGTINAPIDRSPFNRTHFGIFSGGREAETTYKTMTSCQRGSEKYTLLEVFPKTGRTHQIRVHMKYINHPIVADPIYGGRKQSKQDREFCPRLFLHAASLTLKHPKSGVNVTYTSDLPEALKNVINLLCGE